MTEQEHRHVVRILADMIGDSQARERLRQRAVEKLGDDDSAGGINQGRLLEP